MIIWPDFAKRGGVIPVMVLEEETNQPLMLAYIDDAGLRETIATKEAVYFSTSRQKRWKKGEASGNVQEVCCILIDCDLDALVFYVKQIGVACHTGERSCFFREVPLEN